MRNALAFLAMLAATLAAHSSPALAADAARGRQLYETGCIGCHEVSVHSRAKRIATDCRALRAQVERWARQQGTAWTSDEVEDVVLWLNGRYYGFPVENGRCTAPLASLRGPRGG